jgi:hypothetical protein
VKINITQLTKWCLPSFLWKIHSLQGLNIAIAFFILLLGFTCTHNTQYGKTLSSTFVVKPGAQIDLDSLFSSLTNNNNLHANRFEMPSHQQTIFEGHKCSTSFNLNFKGHTIKYKADCSSDGKSSGNSLYFDHIKITHFITENNDTININELNDFAIGDTASVFYQTIDTQNELILLEGYSFVATGRYRLIGSTLMLHKTKNQCFAYLLTTYLGIGSYLGLLDNNQILYLNIWTDKVYQVDEPVELTAEPWILNLQTKHFSPVRNSNQDAKSMKVLATPKENGFNAVVLDVN